MVPAAPAAAAWCPSQAPCPQPCLFIHKTWPSQFRFGQLGRMHHVGSRFTSCVKLWAHGLGHRGPPKILTYLTLNVSKAPDSQPRGHTGCAASEDNLETAQTGCVSVAAGAVAITLTHFARSLLIPHRALWGSWAEGFCVLHFFDYRKQPSFSLHDLPRVPMGRVKQWLIRDTREKQTIESRLGTRFCFPINGYTQQYLWWVCRCWNPLQVGEAND